MRIPISNSIIPSQTENSQLPAAAVAAGSRLPLAAAVPTFGKKRCSSRKKSDLEEIYPNYLMQAFFGDRLLPEAAAAASDASSAGGMGGISSKRKRRRLSLTTQVTAGNRTMSAASTEQFQPGEATDLKRPVRQHLFTIYCRLSGSTTDNPSLYFCTPLDCIGVY
ncbi:unnamed protein product [Mesocestoides corti]|uniref:Uncharacterized protein n=1 Tax=Mesocestoides corti TaxID=53468 RepID=A0A0R3UDN3_MESCO|nr:unnamed protein product [Mesocestoides corti]